MISACTASHRHPTVTDNRRLRPGSPWWCSGFFSRFSGRDFSPRWVPTDRNPGFTAEGWAISSMMPSCISSQNQQRNMKSDGVDEQNSASSTKTKRLSGHLPSPFLFSSFFTPLSHLFAWVTWQGWLDPFFIQWVKGAVVITPPTPVGSTHPLSCTQHIYLPIIAYRSVSIATVVVRDGDEWWMQAGYDLPAWQAFSCVSVMTAIIWGPSWRPSQIQNPSQLLWDALTEPSCSFRDRRLHLCLLKWDSATKDLLTPPISLDTRAVVITPVSFSSHPIPSHPIPSHPVVVCTFVASDKLQSTFNKYLLYVCRNGQMVAPPELREAKTAPF